jgi:N-acyl-D-amino-acid deacylase
MYDLVLTGGTIVDGTRAKAYVADVCIKDGKIAEITEKFAGESKEVVDISGKTISPGFINIHSHSDACPLVDYEPESKLYQGVTTEITGNCGISILPSTPESNASISEYFFSQLELPVGDLSIEGMHTLEDYAKRVNAKGTSINYGQLVGHGTLRGAVMGFVNRDPDENEMEQLKAALERELKNGAFGMSLGLIYPPSAFCQTEELVELAKVLKKYDALLTVHMRNEGPRIFQAVDEMIDITRRSGVHLQISHLKLMGKPQWGRAQELLDKIEAARQEGMTITCDQYPYTATSTSMTALMPHWAHDGGLPALLARVKEPSEELKAAAAQEMDNRGGPAAVLVASTHGYHPEWEGKTVAELSEIMGMAPVDVVMTVLAECKTSVACIYFSINEDDMMLIMKDMRICIGSDGYGFSYDRSITNTNPHPRSFGTFPGFLRIVRESGLMPLEDAVYKLTGLPASFLGMKDRGTLEVGKVADLTVFDSENVRDTSTFLDSVRKPEGIFHVLVAGQFAMRDGEATGVKKGTVLLKK